MPPCWPIADARPVIAAAGFAAVVVPPPALGWASPSLLSIPARSSIRRVLPRSVAPLRGLDRTLVVEGARTRRGDTDVSAARQDPVPGASVTPGSGAVADDLTVEATRRIAAASRWSSPGIGGSPLFGCVRPCHGR